MLGTQLPLAPHDMIVLPFILLRPSLMPIFSPLQAMKEAI